ncbi:MAG: hypothetical protein ACOCQR_01450 [bacterium]
MRQKTIGAIVVLIIIGLIGAMLFIKPFQKPIIKEIAHNETGYLVNLVGSNQSGQIKFDSIEYLDARKVATKEVELAQRWVQTGRLPRQGYWRPSQKLIIVDRAPIAREWTETSDSGTTNKNEGVIGESKESIGFIARVNVIAMIQEKDASTFLYYYPNKSLAEIMDSEIRSMVETVFSEIVNTKKLDEIRSNKKEIMEQVRGQVKAYYEDRGITITVLGWKGEITYLNKDIQKTIDKEFSNQRLYDAQLIENKTIEAKAEAEAKAAKKREETIDVQLKLKQLEIMDKQIDTMKDNWDGIMPKVMGGQDGMFLNMSIDQLDDLK